MSHLLLINHRAPSAEQAVFTAELEKFRPYQSRLVSAISAQEVTLEEIAKTWKALKNGKGRHLVKKAEAAEKRRGNLVARFVHAREGWLQVREGVGYVMMSFLSRPRFFSSVSSRTVKGRNFISSSGIW